MKTDTIEQTGQKLTQRPRGFKILELVDKWRSQHNPLRGLTISYAARLLEDGERGAYADLQWLYRTIEKRFAPLKATKGRLRSSVLKLDWNIKVPEELPAGDEALAEAQRLKLREEYDRIKNFRAALKHVISSEFRGYAHLEKFWERDEHGVWHVTGLNPVPQWHWCRDGILGEWQFNQDSQSGRWQGESVHLENFIVREVEDPIDEIGLICFIRANLAEKDWAAFIEKFGIAAIFLIEPQFGENDPAADTFREIAEKIVSDAAGSLPFGTDVKTIEPKGQATDAFEKYLTHQEEQTVLAATHSKLTMLAESGSGTLAGGAHQDTFDDLAESLAMDISETFQTDFDQQVLNRFFPNQPHYAYFEIAKEDQQDAKDVVAVAKGAKDAGLEIDPEELSEKSGYTFTKAENQDPETDPDKKKDPEKDDDEDEIEPAKNRLILNTPNETIDPAFLEIARAELGASLASDFDQVRDRLEEAVSEQDDEAARRLLEAFLSDLEEMYAAARAGGAAEQAFMDTLASAVANGIESARNPSAPDRGETL